MEKSQNIYNSTDYISQWRKVKTYTTQLTISHPNWTILSSMSGKGIPPPKKMFSFDHCPNVSKETAKEVEVAKVAEQDSDWETIIEDCEKGSEIEFPAIDEDCENWAEKYTTSIRRFHNSGNFSSQTDIKETKCPNCGGAFNPHHQC